MSQDTLKTVVEGILTAGVLKQDSDFESKVVQIDRYLALLEKWNKVTNLTAIRERGRMLTHHVMDSLSVLPFIPLGARRLLDVGSGGGLPGIPLAIARPELAVTLLEPNQKKAAFLQHCKIELNLVHVDVVTERVERWNPEYRYDIVISRAFSDLTDFVSGAGGMLADGGQLIAMKGMVPFEELSRIPPGFKSRVEAVKVQGLEGAERHLIILDRC